MFQKVDYGFPVKIWRLVGCTPPTFPIASLNRFTPNFSGVPQKLTWCQKFGLQSEVMGDICRLEMAVLGVFLDEISFPGQTVDFRL